MFAPRFVAGVAYVALTIAGLVAVKVVELPLAASGHRTVVSVMWVEAVVNVAVEAAMAVEPWTSSKKYPAGKPIRPIVAIGRTVIRRIVKIPIRAHWSDSDTDRNLRWRLGCRP
jgi:hypothetical protein